MKVQSFLLASLIVLVADVTTEKTKSAENYFKDEHFLENSVQQPRVFRGVSKDNTDEELDTLLQKVFKKVESIKGSTGEDVKIGGNGVAYKTPNRIPKQDKRGEKSNKPTFDKNGVANPPKERIPQGVKSKRGSDNDDDVLEDLTKSVDKLIEKLAQKGHKFNEKYYVRKNDKKSTEKKFKFEEYTGGDTTRKDPDRPKKDSNDYEKFRHKFYEMFLDSRQRLIPHGKDHSTPTSTNKAANSRDNVVDAKEWGRLYEELKQQTRKESDKIAELQKKKRIENIRRELLDVLNNIQHSETFTYDGEKFGLAKRDHKEKATIPDQIPTVRDNHVKSTDADDATAKALDARLDTVESLIKKLREIKENKKRVVENSNNGKSLSDKNEVKKEVTEDHRHSTSKEGLKEQTKRADSKIRSMLSDLVEELEKRIISGDKKTPSASSEKRMEKELDEITSVNHNRQHQDEAAQKSAITGFDVKKDSLRERKEVKTSGRP